MLVDYIDFANAIAERRCNLGTLEISSTVPSRTFDYGTYCFNYEESSKGSFVFSPPEAYSSSLCNDSQWLYYANLSVTSPNSPAPDALQIAFNTEQSEAEWSLIPGIAFTGNEGESY